MVCKHTEIYGFGVHRGFWLRWPLVVAIRYIRERIFSGDTVLGIRFGSFLRYTTMSDREIN